MRPFICALALAAGSLSAASPAHEPAPVYDRVRLSASAERQVDTDTLVAVVYKEHQSTLQATAADEVNRAVTWAIERARAAGVTVQTHSYRTQPIYQKQHIQGWRVHQSVRLESTDSAALAALLGDLQQRLSIQSLHNTLSVQARDRAEDSLLVEALQAFQKRAEMVASTLGRSGHRIVEISVDGSGGSPPPPRPMRAALAADASGAVEAPSIEGGTLQVQVRVSGVVELHTPSR
jgi:predicted secreted protein